jgi:hypothetical protein
LVSHCLQGGSKLAAEGQKRSGFTTAGGIISWMFTSAQPRNHASAAIV